MSIDLNNNDFSILIVDDEISITNIYKHYLEKEYSNLYTAYDGSHALKVLEKNKIDMLIMDINMPKMNGFDLLSNLLGSHPNLHVVISTALPLSENHINSFMKKGVHGFLFKPTTKEELIKTISDIRKQVGKKAS